MKAQVMDFRRGRYNYKPRHFILKIDSIDTKVKAEKMIGKEVSWKSPSGKEIKGIVKATHGNSGCFRAIFERGLPGQAINTEVDIK
jgi:large subunit ribosomal protein L35Ae